MKEELKKELVDAFAKTKESFGLQRTFEEYDDIFFLYDMASQDGFIAEKFERQLSARVANTFNSWYNQLHSLILPASASMISLTESSMFDEKEKEKLTLLMNKIVAFISRNTIIALTKNKEAQRAFLDDSISFWEEIKPELLSMAEKLHQGWKIYTK